MQNLTIAEGTATAITVRDVRTDYRWATKVADRPPVPPRAIIVHHTATAGQPEGRRAQMNALMAVADNAPYGLPYNFVAFAYPRSTVYYCNDVDAAWPHTFGWNDATAVALWGDWSIEEPPETALRRMARLIAALRSMWAQDIPVTTHREVYPTICPGDALQKAFGSGRTIRLNFLLPGAGRVATGCPHAPELPF